MSKVWLCMHCLLVLFCQLSLCTCMMIYVIKWCIHTLFGFVSIWSLLEYHTICCVRRDYWILLTYNEVLMLLQWLPMEAFWDPFFFLVSNLRQTLSTKNIEVIVSCKTICHQLHEHFLNILADDAHLRPSVITHSSYGQRPNKPI